MDLQYTCLRGKIRERGSNEVGGQSSLPIIIKYQRTLVNEKSFVNSYRANDMILERNSPKQSMKIFSPVLDICAIACVGVFFYG